MAAQMPAPVPMSACSTSTKGMERNAKKLLSLQCELEKEQIRQQIREAKAPKTVPATVPTPGPIGVATKNAAVTTVTYRDNTGKALEGSFGWAKLETAKAKLEASIAKEEAKSNRPATCSWWSGCPISYVDGYSNAGYGYAGGGGGVNVVYHTGGWRRR